MGIYIHSPYQLANRDEYNVDIYHNWNNSTANCRNIVALYNGLIGARNKVQNAWSQIDVQLKRRADLIPNLVETVKGYAKHEKGVFERVTEARSAIMTAILLNKVRKQ